MGYKGRYQNFGKTCGTLVCEGESFRLLVAPARVELREAVDFRLARQVRQMHANVARRYGEARCRRIMLGKGT